jgi:hypothetical protein
MATHDYVIDNQTAPNFRSDLNSALQAIVTQNASATAPATTYADMIWYDTANNQIKKRDEANSGWITLGTIDESLGTFLPNAIASQAEAEAGTATNKLMTPQRTKQAIDALVVAGGLTLLGTLTTTSGSTQTLSGLTLTNYKYLLLDINGVSHNSGTTQHFNFGTGQVTSNGATSANICNGTALVSLTTGILVGTVARSTLPETLQSVVSQTGYSTATTSVSFSTAAGGTFDAGSVRIYGFR